MSKMNFETNARGGWIVPAGTVIPDNTDIPAWSEIDDDCTLGNGCMLGDWCKLGDGCKLGYRCMLGNGCMLGDWCKLGNVDGSGWQVLIVSDGEKTLIRAGCFIGTPAEFAEKAASEGKHVYAAVIPAVVSAMGVPS